jgi:hypothetical protein
VNPFRLLFLLGVLQGPLQIGRADSDSPPNGISPSPASSSAIAQSLLHSSKTNIRGTWYIRVSAPGSIAAAITAPTTINAWIRNDISPEGQVTLNVCKLSSSGAALSLKFPSPLIATLQGTLPLSGPVLLSPGDSVNLPSFSIESGREAAGRSLDAVPPPFPGGDGDGSPGVTIPAAFLDGFVRVDVYAGLLIAIDMSGVTLVDSSTMRGAARFSIDGIVFDSTSPGHFAPGSTFHVVQSAAASFIAAKLDSDGSNSCATIAGLP